MGLHVNKAPGRRRKVLAGGLAALLGTTAIVVGTAIAAPGDGTVKVRVVQDFNANGNWDDSFVEPGLAGVSVTVTAADGATQTLTTDVEGLVTFTAPPGSVRVAVTNPDPANLNPAIASENASADTPSTSRLSSVDEFVPVAADATSNVTTGFWSPNDYCQTNPLLVGGCQQLVYNGAGNIVDRSGSQSIFTAPFRASGQNRSVTTVATDGQTGSTWGIGYRKQDKRIFTAAYAKRGTNYGPGGQGGIYVMTAAGGATLWGTVPNAGTTAHALGTNLDLIFSGVVGGESLGDLDISEDGSELLVVNLNDKNLYVYDASTPTMGAAKKVIDLSANPGCAAASDWRPFALAERKGTLYVGGVCSAGSTQSSADLRAIVLTYDVTNDYAPLGKVMDQPINYKRGSNAESGCPGANISGQLYSPWGANLPCQVGTINISQPMLTDMEVEDDGSLVLGFRNRVGDTMANGLPYRSSIDNQLYFADMISSGDTNKACKNDSGMFVIDANGACGIAAVNPGQITGEFFTGDRPVSTHSEATYGGLELSRGERGIATTAIDPYGEFSTQGYLRLDRATGRGLITDGGGGTAGANPAERTYNNPTGNPVNNPGQAGGNSIAAAVRYEKGQGLADLEALCDLAPIQIGNRVWIDTDGDGVQGVDEAPIAGVTVNLYDDNDNVVATTVTNSRGEYYFDSRNDNLQANTDYVIRLDKASDYAPGGPLDGFEPTIANQGSGADADRLDSDGIEVGGFSQVALTTGDHGSVDHTLDFGFVAPAKVSVGDFVWRDNDKDGVQDDGEPGIQGVVLKLTGPDGKPVTDVNGSPVVPATTDANGKYTFANLPVLPAGQSYTVTIDKAASAAALVGLVPTLAGVGDGATDSSTDSATSGDLTTNGAQDLTLDFGFYPAAGVSVGDFVWKDTDGDGVQDAGEPGIKGVVLKLTGPDGNPVTDLDGNIVGTQATDDNGAYSFDNLPVLPAGQSYTVTIDKAASAAALVGLVPTLAGVGDGATDSSTDSATSGDLTTDGARDSTLDFGFVPAQGVSVGNFVWEDVNRDGVQDAGDPGIAGVVLKLTGPDGNPVTDLDGNPVGPQTTDADGKYLFDKLPVLPAGQSYTVTIDQAASATALEKFEPTKTGQGTGATDSSTDSAESGDLTTDGAKDLTLDFGFVTTAKVSVGDFVWIDTDKDGVQDDGEPGIAGVVLKLTGPDGKPVEDVNGNPVGSTTTDADGKYTFENLPRLPAGQSYTVTIDKDASAAALKNLVPTATGQGEPGTDSSTDSATSGDLTTDGARDDTLDFGFVPAAGVSVGDFVWKDTDGDGVQDAGEDGIKGVVLKLTGPDGNPVTDINGNPVNPATTDEDGAYAFNNLPVLPAGQSYTVTIDKAASAEALKGLVPTVTGAGNDANDSSTDSATSGDLTTDGAKDTTLDFGFVPAPRVSVGDFVWLDKDKDGVQDGGEPGIQGVVLKLTGPDGKPVTDVNGNPVGPETTDADGKYSFAELPVLPAGQSYTVTIDKPASAAALAGLVPTLAGVGNGATDSSTDSATSGDLTTDGAQDLTLDFGFYPAEGVSVGNFVWKDTDKDGIQDDGEPGIQGVVLKLTGPDGNPVTDVNGKIVGPETTDADGKYSFENLPVLPAGQSYTVTIDKVASAEALNGLTPTKTGAGTPGTDSSTDSATSGDLTTDGAQDNTLDFGFVPEPSVSVGDFVWLDKDKDGVQDGGEPGIAGVVLKLTGPDGNPVTDVNGKLVGPETTDADGKYSFTDLPVLPAGQSYTVTIDKVASAEALKGLVTTVTGAGTPGTDSSTDSATSGDLTTDGAQDLTLDFGFYPAPSVSVGDFVWKDNDGDGVQDAGEPGIQGVVLTLTGPNGNPVTDVNGNPVGPVTTDSDGKYSFDKLPVLPAGQSYTVTVDKTASVAALSGLAPTVTGAGTPGTDSSTDSATSGDLSTDGAKDDTLDFGFAPKPRVSVGDFVWVDNDRDGVQDAGDPGIQGVVLILTGPDGKPVTDVNGNTVGTRTTDGNGKYSFDDLPVLPAGQSYTVTIDKAASAEALEGFKPTKTGQGTPGSDSSTDSATSGDLTTNGAKDLTLDFGFVSTDTVSVGDFIWKDLDKDGVQDAGEPGIGGVVVKLTGPDGNPVTDVDGNPVGPVTTDGNGKYSFGNLPTLPAGQSYTVTIDKAASAEALKGLVPTATGQGTPGTDSSTDSATSGDLTTKGATDDTLDFGFAPAPQVSVGDLVWLDKDKDGVQDAGEPGIGGVVIKLTGPDGKPVTDVNGNVVGPVTTDKDGKYSFNGLPVLPEGQSYTVQVDEAASKAALAGLTPVDGTTRESTDLSTDGATDRSMIIGYFPTPSVSVGDRVFLDENGNGVQNKNEPGIPGVVLTLTGPDGKPVTDIFGNVVGPVTTDDEGRYVFEGLPVLAPGEKYTVTVDVEASGEALDGFAPTTPGSSSSGDLVTGGASDLTLDFGFQVDANVVSPGDGDGPGAVDGEGALPDTGSPVSPGLLGAAALMLVLGAHLVYRSRRRREA